VLLLSTKKVTPHRQLDDKKRKQLSIIFGEQLMYAIGDNEELSRLDLSFSKVDIEADMSAIKVYWLARGDSEDDHIAQQLENAANGLR
jgi:ribosome-binding factor A